MKAQKSVCQNRKKLMNYKLKSQSITDRQDILACLQGPKKLKLSAIYTDPNSPQNLDKKKKVTQSQIHDKEVK